MLKSISPVRFLLFLTWLLEHLNSRVWLAAHFYEKAPATPPALGLPAGESECVFLFCPRRSHPHSQSVVTVMGGEEHFEDYGEGSEAELSPETLCNGEHGCREPTFLSPW